MFTKILASYAVIESSIPKTNTFMGSFYAALETGVDNFFFLSKHRFIYNRVEGLSISILDSLAHIILSQDPKKYTLSTEEFLEEMKNKEGIYSHLPELWIGNKEIEGFRFLTGSYLGFENIASYEELYKELVLSLYNREFSDKRITNVLKKLKHEVEKDND